MGRLRPVGHEDQLSLIDHLDELRSRLIACVVVFMVAFSFCYWQNNRLLHIVNRPLESTQNLNGKHRSKDPLEESARFSIKTGEALKALTPALQGQKQVNTILGRRLPSDARALLAAQQRRLDQAVAATRAAAEAVPTNTARQPITLGVTEPFVTTFTIAAYAALLLSLPFILYQAYAFILPAFNPRERQVALPLMLMVPILFVSGVAFGYFVALPRAIDFLQNFNDDSFDILIRAADYYRFSIIMLGLIGLLFQIPVGVLAVTRMGLISARQLAHNRGYVILGIAVLAAVATPTPDPVTMIIAMAPLIVLFELSVLLARIFERRSEGRRGRWDVDDDPAVS